MRSMRHLAERDPNMHAVETETPRHMSGLDFPEAILSNRVPAGTYHEGITCTHYKAYLLCFKAEAPSVDAVQKLLNPESALEFTGKTTAH